VSTTVKELTSVLFALKAIEHSITNVWFVLRNALPTVVCVLYTRGHVKYHLLEGLLAQRMGMTGMQVEQHGVRNISSNCLLQYCSIFYNNRLRQLLQSLWLKFGFKGRHEIELYTIASVAAACKQDDLFTIILLYYYHFIIFHSNF
jgi:hypothetical protein